MGFDRLHAYREASCHLFVRIAPRYLAQDLFFTGGQLIEFGVHRLGDGAAECVENEAGEPGENTASPPLTRSIASASSSGAIDLVT